MLNDHETIIRLLRRDIDKLTDEIKDTGTADFVTGMMENMNNGLGFYEAM